jgi:hypothetical protein
LRNGATRGNDLFRRTAEESLDILAWHPDSDFGLTDEDHPMLNRTLLR